MSHPPPDLPASRRPSVLLIGPTGSGKSPLGAYLERRGLFGRRCLHFDFGENLRRAAGQGGGAYGLTAEEREVVRAVLRDGALLEDRQFGIAEKILDGLLRAGGAAADDWLVLNGLPRHAGQAEALSGRVDVRLVASLDCSPDVVLRRIATNAGGDREGRGDDSPREVERKLEIFRLRTAPLLDHYRRLGVTIAAVPVAERTAPADIVETLEREYGSTHGHHR